MYKVRLRTKNHSSNELRNLLNKTPKRTIVRLGSITPTDEIYRNTSEEIIELNTVEAVKNSRSKLLMKKCFKDAGVDQSEWYTKAVLFPEEAGGREFIEMHSGSNDDIYIDASSSDFKYPILAKRIFGFKGRGMVKINNYQELRNFVTTENQSGYYFEEFHNYAKEYRLHMSQTECFMTWRKLRRNDATSRYFFNSENCNWVSDEHELFDEPTCWDEIMNQCIDAMVYTGLDICCFDVRVQSSRKENPKFIIVECNSAPALGEKGVEAYKDAIENIIYLKSK